MKVIADLALMPLGAGLSLPPYVAACERVLAEAELEPQLHANGTTVEGKWDQVFAALKRCHESLWLLLWDATRAVAEAHGLGPDDLAHILTTSSGVQKKRPPFCAHFFARLEDWRSGRLV